MAQVKPSWKQPRFLADLTPHQREALVRCHALTVLVVEKRDDAGGPAKHGIAPRTLNTLVDGGYLAEGRDGRARRVWKPTVAGLALIAAEEPRYLARNGSYTVDASKAMFPDAGLAVDETTQNRFSDEGRERDHARAAGVDEEALAALAALRTQRHELARVAHRYGIDLRSQVKLVDRAQNALEQQIRQQRTAARQAA